MILPSSLIGFFDIETIPDISLIRNVLQNFELDEDSLYELAIQTLTHNNTHFLPPIFHRIIGWVILRTDHEGKIKTKQQWCSSDESEGLKIFLEQIENPLLTKVLHFNGRGFDIPLLRYRAMKHNLQLPKLFLSRDFNYRYGNTNIDIMDRLSDFGASSYPKLEHIATLIDIKLKATGRGQNVWEFFRKKDYTKVITYCLEDVIGTYLVWLSWQYTIQNINKETYKDLRIKVEERLHKIQFSQKSNL